MENSYSPPKSASLMRGARLSTLVLAVLATYMAISRAVHFWSQFESLSKFEACVLIALLVTVAFRFFLRATDEAGARVYWLASILYGCVIFAVEAFARS